ncbi:hypothetical protein DICPUDRAFT_147464 [Dictyostelium purpureum]|uniref:DNA2/NAM7 helicase-like C-terminal domain-containing protein n=1 Tax=Dictyostelium purpureum TaxID=5786 RepID=F0Z8J5_DICPU|nr:uncharacterized protein DICPUDRAFT_147464 [Dictyostelium purpureum]EGC39771.1 hypothetical protein DICPUDRAFT_147464 [Dictyostelium purpureum]|eukprot:XP_003283757.1 hypothetical protein DICPUDRAFT_147464 [Dictyostelium purpureum]
MEINNNKNNDLNISTTINTTTVVNKTEISTSETIGNTELKVNSSTVVSTSINNILSAATETPIVTPATTTEKPKKELKNLVKYQLIDIEKSSCFIKYKDIKKEVKLIIQNDEPYFKVEKPESAGEFIIEQSATTLLKSFLKDVKVIKGNYYVFINDKRIDDYSFDDIKPSPSPSPNATPKQIKRKPRLSTNNDSNSTPISTTNINDVLETPGIDRSPYGERKTTIPETNKRGYFKDIDKDDYKFTLKKEPVEIKYEDQQLSSIETAIIKPSGIGRFFHFGCERYLSFSTRVTKKENDPIKSIQSPISTVQQKLIDEGFEWEAELLQYLEEKSNEEKSFRVFKPKGEAADITIEETIRILKEEKGDFYMVQSTLEPPKTFRKHLPESIKFSYSKPDFLHIVPTKDGKRKIIILDAKSTTTIAFHQKVQLAFYKLLLNDIIKEQGIQDLKVSNKAGIYLKGIYEVEPFSLKDPVRILSSFLFGDQIKKQSYLLDILSVPKVDSPWILSERCDGCEFIDHCTNQLEKEHTLNTAVNIKSSLKSLIPNNKDSDINDLEYLLKEVSIDQINHPSLKVDYMKSKPMIQAILTDQVVPTGFFDSRLSSYEDIQIYLEIINNPLSQSIYQWGVLIVDSKKENPSFAKGDSFSELIEGLSVLFQQNEKVASLQTYIFDSFQKSVFFRECFKKLKEIEDLGSNDPKDITFKESLLLVLRVLLNSNEWINFNIGHYPQLHVPRFKDLSLRQDDSSFLVVHDLITTSFAINVKPFYTFENIIEKLILKKDTTKDQDQKKEIIDKINREKNEIFDNIIQSKDNYAIIENKLHYQYEMVSILKKEVFKSTQDKKSPPFIIRAPSSYNDNKNLAKLYFCYQHECFSSYKKLKSYRSNPLAVNLLEGLFYLLKLNSIEPNKNKFILKLSTKINIQNISRFQSMIDKTFSTFGIINTNSYLELLNHNDILQTKLYSKYIDDVSFKGQSYQIEGDYIDISLELQVSSDKNFNDKIGNEFILFEVFDLGFFAMHKGLLNSYENMQKSSVFLNILDNPIEWCKENNNEDFERLAREVVDSFREISTFNDKTKLTMTPSQENIFNSIIKRRLQLVRGPPGTGKTHFLALIVLIFMESYKRLGKPFRIAITSFTHNAIDNLLIRIASLKKEYSTSVGQDINFPLFKKQTKLSEDLKLNKIQLFDKKEFEREHFCVGATSWSLSNMDYENFDLLIIDEASQLSSYIGAIPFSRLNKDTGRVIVCGDNKQLGPVLMDRYPSRNKLSCRSEPYDPKLQKSIFSCIKSLLVKYNIKDPYLSLYENFRMNKQLCEFSQNLYGQDYKCFKEDQEQIKPLVTINNSDNAGNELIQSIFNSNDSCHTILLDDSQFGNRDLEAQIVKQIYKFLRNDYNNRPTTEKTVFDGSIPISEEDLETNFWRKDLILGVITPLHIQRNTIIPIIHNVQSKEFNLGTEVSPIVNTVEVTQGKEFENVVLCYNGFDEINRISEFSFDLNRLNVGFTRSKKRFILIVSSKLFFPDESIFDNKRMSLAYNHLIKYVGFSKIHKFNIDITSNTNISNNTTLDSTLGNLIDQLNMSVNLSDEKK